MPPRAPPSEESPALCVMDQEWHLLGAPAEGENLQCGDLQRAAGEAQPMAEACGGEGAPLLQQEVLPPRYNARPH